MMKLLQTHIKFLPRFLSLPLAMIGAMFFLHTVSTPEPAISSTISWQFADNPGLPPLAPVQEENSDSNGILRGLLPGTLPPALVTRRSGERINCRLLRDSNTDIARPVSLHIPVAFFKQRAVAPILEFHTFLQHSLPPRAGPAVV